MQIDEMNMEEIKARSIEIISEMENATEERLAELKAEAEAIALRKSELVEIETRRKQAADLEAGKAEPDVVVERSENVEKENTDMEIRNTAEYGKAFVRYIMSGEDAECRTLLSDMVEGGSVPVPEVLETEIKNAWEDCQIMSLVKQTGYKGIVKVGFEYSATGAEVHVEGTDAPAEETLVFGTVELKPQSLKKWITVSDEAIDATTIDTLGYLYRELAQKIVELAESMVIAAIVAAPAASTMNACGVPVFTANTLDVDTITNAVAELSGQAKNLHLAMNRRTYAVLKGTAKKAHYGVDPFDGIPVVYTDALKAHSAASAGETTIIAGDFGYGFQANFPAGNDMTIKVDDVSLAEKDLVKVIGRQYVGMGVVAPKAFVKIVK